MSKELEALNRIYSHLPTNDGERFREDFVLLETTLIRLEETNYFLGIDIFTFIEIMNPFHNFYVWDNHNKQIVKLCCFGARRTYDGKQIYVNNMSCTAWLALKEYGNTWSLYKSDLEKKWLNNKENEDGRK